MDSTFGTKNRTNIISLSTFPTSPSKLSSSVNTINRKSKIIPPICSPSTSSSTCHNNHHNNCNYKQQHQQQLHHYSPSYKIPSGSSTTSSSTSSCSYYDPHLAKQKHTFVTNYGTEENLYEEIPPDRYFNTLGGTANTGTSSGSSAADLNVDSEWKRVQNQHRQVLGQLNLAVETMLMPDESSFLVSAKNAEQSDDTEAQDESIISTSNLLHIDIDSGFSGSSSSASYNGSFKRVGFTQQQPLSTNGGCLNNNNGAGGNHNQSSSLSSSSSTSLKQFFSKKTWKKLPGFSTTNSVLNRNNNNNNNNSDESKVHQNGGGTSCDDNKTSLNESILDKQQSRRLQNHQYHLDYKQQQPLSPQLHQHQSSPTATISTIISTTDSGLCIQDYNSSNQLDHPRLQQQPQHVQRDHNNYNHSHSHSFPLKKHTDFANISSGLGLKGHPLHKKQLSSDDSWCLPSSDQDFSSDEDTEKSSLSPFRNGQLRNTLNKAKNLCDKWRIGSCSTNLSLVATNMILPSNSDHQMSQSRISRWFSIRRGSVHQYDIENIESSQLQQQQQQQQQSHTNPLVTQRMPLVNEDEEDNSLIMPIPHSRRQLLLPPMLPEAPSHITQLQLKRRMIVNDIVHSENSYVATLQRLVHDYKKPLEESNPAILNITKISTLFYRLPEILQCHSSFRVLLADYIRNWDRDERIGDAFVASFSKSNVLDIYSGFINNFSVAMEMAKMESKRKSALADFFKVKQISSHDRLSFFGLMVKPVQRFPQFILLLQNLLKYTPHDHHDRMSLQLALTQLESMAEMLNERKREAEQFQAFKETLRHISGKFSIKPLSDANRYLLKEDNMTQLEFNQSGYVTKSKRRRLLLLNDLILCVSVTAKNSDDFGVNSERLSLKWTHSVSELEILDSSLSPTLSRILNPNRSSSLKSSSTVNSFTSDTIGNEMNNLMHDFEVMSRVNDLVGSLHKTYDPVTIENCRNILTSIQISIQKKDEEIAWLDSCCLQLLLKSRNGKEELFTFQTDNPTVKREWITEFRLAQLALDANNSPAWQVPDSEHRPSTKMPLFVKTIPVCKSSSETEVCCGCFYTINVSNIGAVKRKNKYLNYLWICTTDGIGSRISILSQNQHRTESLKEISSFDLVETQITAIEFVKGSPFSLPSNDILDENGLASDTVWLGTDSHKIIIYLATDVEKNCTSLGTCTVPTSITQIRYHYDGVYVALSNGSVFLYRRSPLDGTWILKEQQVIVLGKDPVTNLLPISNNLYTSCGQMVYVLNGLTAEIQKSFKIQHENLGNVCLIAHSGVGLWISMDQASVICLYHTETFRHLQDINIAPNVARVCNSVSNMITITALMACKGLLWVGTNVGVVLTIPLPRLEGVPIISGKFSVSYHGHVGPIRLLLPLLHRVEKDVELFNDDSPKRKNDKTKVSITTTNELDKRLSDSLIKPKQQFLTSPIVVRRRKIKDFSNTRLSKTLPRGLGRTCSNSTASSQSSSDTCDVYGLYGELMFLKDYDGDHGVLADPVYESLRRSDPELAAIPAKVTTLDRRMKIKLSRPRSLDLSDWSVESRTSSMYTTSSGSEDNLRNPVRLQMNLNNNSVSRNNSIDSRKSGDFNDNSKTNTEECAMNAETSTDNNSKGNNGDFSRRTVITLMGGRGYLNWYQKSHSSSSNISSTNSTERSKLSPCKDLNMTDAHIVIWELKL